VTVTERGAWQDDTHARVFDEVSTYPDLLMKKRFEGFNEVRLLQAYRASISGTTLYEIGCATGEFCRYASRYLHGLQYTGFDISRPAIARARQKYGANRFVLLGSGIEAFAAVYGQADVVFCRDVVLHQREPYRFLMNLLGMAREALVLRLRTRDVGATVFDAEQSCQYHYDRHWVPYIVLNTDELLDKVAADQSVVKIVVSRRYEVLGGHNFRFLPKELYYSESRTAETALLVIKGKASRRGKAEIVFDDRPDGPQFSLLDRAILRLFRRDATGSTA
jgi:SAM-dependent methyltransferase